MDYSNIGPLVPGWGSLYQGAACDPGIKSLPGPLWIVCMNRGEVDDALVTQNPVYGLTVMAIDDAPTATVPDALVIAGAHADARIMRGGCNLIAHCGAGISRSSYRNLATIMMVRRIGLDAALAFLRQYRPQANPNPGFVAQLRRLEPVLIG